MKPTLALPFLCLFTTLHSTTNAATEVSARPDTAATPSIANASGPLTLRDAVQRALSNNPALAATGYDVRAAEARQLQAGLRPNPVLGLDVEDVLGSGQLRSWKSAQTTLQISQVFELGGKREARTAVAGAGRERVLREAQMARVEVLGAVADRFIRVVEAQEMTEVSRAATRLAKETLETARRRVEAAKSSSLEEKRAQILLARAELEQSRTEQELLTARYQLVALWGGESATFSEAKADLFARPPLPEFGELASRIAHSPAVALWATEKFLRDAEVKLADARRRPDMTLGGGLRHYAGPDDVGLVFGFSIPLAFRDRNQGARVEARELRAKADLEQVGTEQRLRAALFGLAQALRQSDSELGALENSILPEAEAALTLAREGMELARFSQLDLLDSQRTLLELRRERVLAASSYHRFIVEIEKLLGEPLTTESAQTSKP
jgi:outer membrane protein, heavy metal efflux system